MAINKRALALLSMVWILCFHLWISLSGSAFEQFLLRTGYVGVDLFFFLSAYSMAGSELHYGAFLRNRFCSIYLKFLAAIAIMAVYKGWTLSKVLQTACFADFFRRGGGSFLWFIPAVMLLYLLFPLFLRWRARYKTVLCLAIWLAGSVVLDRIIGYHEIFIFTARFPVILCGYLLARHSALLPSRKPWVRPLIATCCVLFGMLLLYYWGNTRKLNLPFTDFYYVLAIPTVLGLAALSIDIPQNKAVTRLGSIGLEVYALQMMFGPALVHRLYRLTDSSALTNLLMLVIVMGAALVISVLWRSVARWLNTAYTTGFQSNS